MPQVHRSPARPSKVHVRLKKVTHATKSAGIHCRRYVYRGTLFRHGEWRIVPRTVAEDLSRKIQPNSELSPKPLFDIAMTRAEAEAMDKVDTPATQVAGARDVPDTAFRGPAVNDIAERSFRVPQPGGRVLDGEELPDGAGPNDLDLDMSDEDMSDEDMSDEDMSDEDMSDEEQAQADEGDTGPPKATRGRARK